MFLIFIPIQMALNTDDITLRQFEKLQNLKISRKFLNRARLSTSEINYVMARLQLKLYIV